MISLCLTCHTRKQKILDRLLILGPGECFEAVEGVEVEEVGHGHAEEGGLAAAEQRGPALVPAVRGRVLHHTAAVRAVNQTSRSFTVPSLEKASICKGFLLVKCLLQWNLHNTTT